LTGAANTIGPIVVEVTLFQNSEAVAPAGTVDTPTDGATGLAGSIAVSGWAIDDVGVTKVELWRDPVLGEGAGLVFIGKAVLVDGARPDVAAAYPALPRNTMAGWGYLMLTNSLPFRGNGTFTIHAIATDVEGHATTIGSKTMTCANDASIEPFGAIDTPAQGEIVSGSSYTNYGWVLANREIKAAPPDGGIVQAFIDGVEFAPPGGWTDRQDLTALFPAASYSGVAHALGVTSFDTRTLTNGVHSISWVATASNGQRAGIGSRFFSVSNNTLMSGVRSALSALPDVDEVNRVPLARAGVVVGRRGYDLTAPLQTYPVDASGRATLWAEELDRIEVQLGAPGYTGYLRIGDRLGPLPIGSTIDAATGTFTWGVGVAFVHDYDLVFVRREHERLAQRQEVRISLRPKLSRRAGAQLVIDTPHVPASGDDPAVVQPFLVAGWAVDLGETVGTGIGTLHVWAFPVRPGHEPIFLGATAYGGARPDVSALYGERFKPSGYGLMVTSLSPGTYDLGVFAWSTVTGTFAPAKVVRVTVR
jgi:hypothetical protein